VNKGRWVLVAAVTTAVVTSLAPAAAASGGDRPQVRDSIEILKNADFDAAHGVVAGSGTMRDPYLISGWDVHHLEIKDTSKHVVIRNNSIGRLILDWIGGGAHVYNNTVDDLRVNQNVKRTGDMTSGIIANNRFDVVGQLRHWDGVFENNTVGSPSRCSNIPFFSCRAVNFDGFNGAKFRNNNIFGYVEVRLHGHHHSSDFSDHSHYHGAGHEDMADHTKRFHQVWVTNNTIHSGDYYGLLYTDSAHSANDRTAASETNPDLNLPHSHKTRVHFTNNKIFGSGIQVDIFNADDDRHLGTKTGLMEIKNNTIKVQSEDYKAEETFSSRDGIYVSRATDVKLSIVGNAIDGAIDEQDTYKPIRERFDYGSGINLYDIDKARVYLFNNQVTSRTYGVQASGMSSTVQWWIKGLKTSDVEKAVYYDSSVKNEPNRKS
jgi:hypothetical protein